MAWRFAQAPNGGQGNGGGQAADSLGGDRADLGRQL